MVKHKKSNKNIYLILIVLIISVLIASFLFFKPTFQNKIENSENKISKTRQSMNIPKYEDYITGTEIFDTGIRVDLPEGWEAKIQNGHLTSKDLIAFRLLPPEMIKKYENYYNQPEGLLIPIYALPPESSFNEWFDKNFEGKKDLFIITERKIGDKTSYLLTPDRSKIKGPDDLGTREVVFTDKHTYVFGYHVYEISERVVNGIYPRFKFE